MTEIEFDRIKPIPIIPLVGRLAGREAHQVLSNVWLVEADNLAPPHANIILVVRIHARGIKHDGLAAVGVDARVLVPEVTVD